MGHTAAGGFVSIPPYQRTVMTVAPIPSLAVLTDLESAATAVERVRLTRRVWLASASVLLVPATALGARTRDVERYERDVSDSAERAGAARAGVGASLARVESVVTDYAGYARFIDQFEKARVVARSGASTDLYIEIPILHGLTKIWAVLRFGAPVRQADATLVKGKMVKGNVKRLDVTWRIHRVDADWTRLAAELLLDISLPAPRSAVMKTVKRAAAQAVKGARREAESRA